MEHIYAKLQDRAREKLIPFDVMFEVTHRCNLNCVHCFNPRDRSRPEMTTEQAAHALDQIAGAGGFMLTFTGGEPLTRPDFFDIAGHAKKSGFALMLISNGTLIDQAMADRLAQLHFTDVSVTLYSPHRETHEAVTRTPGSHAASLSAVRHLTDRGLKVTIRSVIMKPNAADYEDLIEFAESRGLRYLIDPGVSPRQDGDPAPLKQQLPEEELKPIIADERTNFSFDGMPREGPPWPNCDAAHSTCSLDPYGNILPCLQLPLIMGNVLEEPFEKIWRDSPVAREFRALTVSQMPECKKCDIAAYCTRCPGNAYLEGHGLTGRSDYACTTARITFELMNKKTGK